MKRTAPNGMAMVELMIALAIATASFASLFAMLDSNVRILDSNRQELDATLLAQSAIERLRAASWSEITNMPAMYPIPAGSNNVTGVVEIVPLPGYEPAPAPRRVTANVSWRERDGHSNACALTTIIGPWSRQP